MRDLPPPASQQRSLTDPLRLRGTRCALGFLTSARARKQPPIARNARTAGIVGPLLISAPRQVGKGSEEKERNSWEETQRRRRSGAERRTNVALLLPSEASKIRRESRTEPHKPRRTSRAPALVKRGRKRRAAGDRAVLLPFHSAGGGQGRSQAKG